jgi:hypothetical protein
VLRDTDPSSMSGGYWDTQRPVLTERDLALVDELDHLRCGKRANDLLTLSGFITLGVSYRTDLLASSVGHLAALLMHVVLLKQLHHLLAGAPNQYLVLPLRSLQRCVKPCSPSKPRRPPQRQRHPT